MPRINATFYALTWEQAQRDYQDGILTTRGLIFTYFRTKLKPGSGLAVDVDELCKYLSIGRASYYRAVGALQAARRLNLKQGKMIVEIPPEAEAQAGQDLSQLRDLESQERDLESQEGDWESQERDWESQERDWESQERDWESQNRENEEGCGKPSEALQASTSIDWNLSQPNVPNRSTDLLKEQTDLTEHCFVLGIDREGIGTSGFGVEAGSVVSQTAALERFSGFIQDSGVRPNKTIQETLAALIEHKGVAAAARLVENALSALEEQRDRGRVRNPGGFLRAALQRGFTSNQAKREARDSPPAKPPEPPDSLKLAQVIDASLWNGDRAYALERLNTEWQAGWHDLIEELVTFLRPDWGFQIVDGEVK